MHSFENCLEEFRGMADFYISLFLNVSLNSLRGTNVLNVLFPGGVMPYMGYIGMCRCEGYGFQAVYSRIGCINQSVWD